VSNPLNGRERPTKFVDFGANANTNLNLPYPRYPIVKDLTPLYSENLDWIIRTLDFPGDRSR
jgi:hypothetical protein